MVGEKRNNEVTHAPCIRQHHRLSVCRAYCVKAAFSGPEKSVISVLEKSVIVVLVKEL